MDISFDIGTTLDITLKIHRDISKISLIYEASQLSFFKESDWILILSFEKKKLCMETFDKTYMITLLHYLNPKYEASHFKVDQLCNHK